MYERKEPDAKPGDYPAYHHDPKARRQSLYDTTKREDHCARKEGASSSEGVADATGRNGGHCQSRSSGLG